MKLSDTHGWTPDTELEQLALEGQDLRAFLEIGCGIGRVLQHAAW
jgi:hypothetical protein